MRPGIHPIIDFEDVVPSAFLVLSELPILRHEIENRQSESPVQAYGTLVGVRIVWGLNFENVALHVTLILRHCLPSLKSHERSHNLRRNFSCAYYRNVTLSTELRAKVIGCLHCAVSFLTSPRPRKLVNNDRPPLPTALVDRRTPGLFHCEGW